MKASYPNCCAAAAYRGYPMRPKKNGTPRTYVLWMPRYQNTPNLVTFLRP